MQFFKDLNAALGLPTSAPSKGFIEPYYQQDIILKSLTSRQAAGVLAYTKQQGEFIRILLRVYIIKMVNGSLTEDIAAVAGKLLRLRQICFRGDQR